MENALQMLQIRHNSERASPSPANSRILVNTPVSLGISNEVTALYLLRFLANYI